MMPAARPRRSRPQPIDQPALERLHPGLKDHEQRERPLDVGELPAGLQLKRLDEERPRVLQVGDHHHRQQRGVELKPAVVDGHRAAL
jgi:hypothetical protein